MRGLLLWTLAAAAVAVGACGAAIVNDGPQPCGVWQDYPDRLAVPCGHACCHPAAEPVTCDYANARCVSQPPPNEGPFGKHAKDAGK